MTSKIKAIKTEFKLISVGMVNVSVMIVLDIIIINNFAIGKPKMTPIILVIFCSKLIIDNTSFSFIPSTIKVEISLWRSNKTTTKVLYTIAKVIAAAIIAMKYIIEYIVSILCLI